MPAAGRFLRDHAFLVAAAALPLVVVLFFLLSTIVPRFTVAPPAYDLLLTASSYDRPQRRVALTFAVRDGQVQATTVPARPDAHPPRTSLWIVDRATSAVREITVDVPDLSPGDPPQTFVVSALAGRRVLVQTTAPDGYELRTRRHSSPGIVGDLFGMRRYDEAASVVRRGRVIRIDLPPPYEHQAPDFLGWVLNGGG